MGTLRRSVWISRSRCFRCTGSMRPARWWSAGSLSRGRILAFFEKLPRCLVGIEACSSSHYWARELIALGS